MDQFKPTQVIILPTEDRCFIFMSGDKTWLTSSNVILDDHPVERNQHLYIISDDEIEDGDWCYKENVGIFQCKEKPNIQKSWGKKIIATTDTSLKIKVLRKDGSDTTNLTVLPQPSQQFIEKYIEEYNKGNIIIDVLVEMNKSCCNCDTSEKVLNCCYNLGDIDGTCTAPNPNNDFYGLKLKINPKDNSININLIN